jgi:transposase-like protein
MARKLERLEAKRLYVEEGEEIKTIAAKLNVPDKTLYKWKDEDGWDDERKENTMTSASAVKQSYRAAISAMEKITKEFETTGKLNSADVQNARMLIKNAKELQRDVDMLGNIFVAQREWLQFAQERDPDLVQRMLPYLNEFKDEMKKKYGKR